MYQNETIVNHLPNSNIYSRPQSSNGKCGNQYWGLFLYSCVYLEGAKLNYKCGNESETTFIRALDVYDACDECDTDNGGIDYAI